MKLHLGRIAIARNGMQVTITAKLTPTHPEYEKGYRFEGSTDPIGTGAFRSQHFILYTEAGMHAIGDTQSTPHDLTRIINRHAVDVDEADVRGGTIAGILSPQLDIVGGPIGGWSLGIPASINAAAYRELSSACRESIKDNDLVVVSTSQTNPGKDLPVDSVFVVWKVSDRHYCAIVTKPK